MVDGAGLVASLKVTIIQTAKLLLQDYSQQFNVRFRVSPYLTL